MIKGLCKWKGERCWISFHFRNKSQTLLFILFFFFGTTFWCYSLHFCGHLLGYWVKSITMLRYKFIFLVRKTRREGCTHYYHRSGVTFNNHYLFLALVVCLVQHPRFTQSGLHAWCQNGNTGENFKKTFASPDLLEKQMKGHEVFFICGAAQ